MTKRESLVTTVVLLLQNFALAEQVLDPYGYASDQKEDGQGYSAEQELDPYGYATGEVLDPYGYATGQVQNSYGYNEGQQESAPRVSAIWEPEPASRWTHACYAEGDHCDGPGYYYNWLACECFAKDPACGWMICPDGESHDPTEPCGLCLPDDMIRSLYPEWATEADIAESIEDGIERAQNRPDDWRVCNEEETPHECGEDEYWNELACSCLSSDYCPNPCGAGSVLDPVEGCGGSCVRIPELYEYLYPEWATPMDVELAEAVGMSKRWDEQNRFRVCPLLYDVAYPCEAGKYWNELACECFTVTTCLMACGDDEDFHPLKQCECEKIDVIKQEVYPDWASQLDIENAEKDGLETYWPQPEPEEWPQCNPTPSCSADTYFNALSCTCWPLVDYCLVGCGAGEERDPRAGGCECISEDEFSGLFPAWASDWEIQESMLGQWREPDPCPEPWLEVPEDWPQCPPTDECDSADVNLLACECFARVNCYNYCGDDEVHDPIGGCECIPREEYKLYFPDWATEHDIELSELLFWQ